MLIKYMNTLLKKVEEYSKKYNSYTINPLLNRDYFYNPFRMTSDSTYLWVENPKENNKQHFPNQDL